MNIFQKGILQYLLPPLSITNCTQTHSSPVLILLSMRYLLLICLASFPFRRSTKHLPSTKNLLSLVCKNLASRFLITTIIILCSQIPYFHQIHARLKPTSSPIHQLFDSTTTFNTVPFPKSSFSSPTITHHTLPNTPFSPSQHVLPCTFTLHKSALLALNLFP